MNESNNSPSTSDFRLPSGVETSPVYVDTDAYQAYGVYVVGGPFSGTCIGTLYDYGDHEQLSLVENWEDYLDNRLV